MLDVRFAPLAENMWDLRSRRTYNETHVDTSAILGEDEYLSDDEVEEYLNVEDEEVSQRDEEEE
jgi:DNA-directed RNA polymerase subunit delta